MFILIKNCSEKRPCNIGIYSVLHNSVTKTWLVELGAVKKKLFLAKICKKLFSDNKV